MRFGLSACTAALGALACGVPEPRVVPVVGDPTGRWLVIADTAPGVSSMTGPERTAWHGREAEYHASTAHFGTDSCGAPGYASKSFNADTLFGQRFRLAPSDLGFVTRSRVTVTEVTCAGVAWTAPGAQLLWVSPTRAYTIWNGVFFLLERR